VPPGAFVQTYCPVVSVQRPIRFGFQDKSWVTVTLLLEVEMLCAELITNSDNALESFLCH